MKKRSKLRPASQTAFSSVTSGAIRRIAIDAIYTQSTISTCVIYKDLYGKPLKHDCVFSDTNPSNFRPPLQSLLLRYTAETLQFY